MKIALAQIAPVLLDLKATLTKVSTFVQNAAQQGAQLVVFGEAILPGYPFWVELTDGARFNSEVQKQFYAEYVQQAVCIEAGDLEPLCEVAREQKIHVVVGVIERPTDRGGHSLYCALVYIDDRGVIRNVHRKLMPTYEERLVWSPGDGHGLRTFRVDEFTIGALNCWENWMPLPRAALYSLGENLHIALWPGNVRNTEILTRFLAREGRSYVVSISGLMRRSDLPAALLHRNQILENMPDVVADGGSCVAQPDGTWLLEPVVGKEGLWVVELDHDQVLRERQNFDPSGHYSRPDVTQLRVRRARQRTVWFDDQNENPIEA